MINISTNIHEVTAVTTRARCLNGNWQWHIGIRCEDGSELEFVLYTRARVSLQELADEHVLVEDRECKVERRATPFAEGQL